MLIIQTLMWYNWYWCRVFEANNTRMNMTIQIHKVFYINKYIVLLFLDVRVQKRKPSLRRLRARFGLLSAFIFRFTRLLTPAFPIESIIWGSNNVFSSSESDSPPACAHAKKSSKVLNECPRERLVKWCILWWNL